MISPAATRIRLPRFLLAWALGASCLMGCQGSSKAPLRVGVPPWPGFELLFLAQEKGFFEAEGAQVRLVEYTTLVDVLRAMELGHIDIMAASPVELLMLRHTAKPGVAAFHATDFSNGADVLLAKPSIRSLSDLRGKRIGTEAGAFGILFLHRALGQTVPIEEVTLVPMDLNNVKRGLEEGTLDAAACFPPYSSEILGKGIAKPLFTSREIPGEILSLLAADSHLIAQRPEEFAAIAKAWDKAMETFLEKPELVIGPMAARMGISPADFREALTGIELLESRRMGELFSPGSPFVQSLVRQEEILRDLGRIAGPSRVAGILFLPGKPRHGQR